MSNKRGRPKGAIQTPATMLLAEMRESSALLRKTRKINATQLKQAEEELKALPMVDKLEVLSKLAQITTALNTTIEQASKYITTAPNKEAEDSGEELLKEILGKV